MAPAVSGGYLDASDLGVCPDSEMYRELAEDLGSLGPWSLADLTNLFDRRYPGWDEGPETLAASSPVSRFRILSRALRASGAEREVSVEEALGDLSQEVKHALIKVICHQVDSSPLQDECQLLLVLVDQLGALFLAEREARHEENETAAKKLAELEEARRSAFQEGAAEAREELSAAREELSGEAEAQQRRADLLQREVEALQVHEMRAADLELRLATLEREHVALQRAHETTQDELCQAKAQRAAIAIAHEESEGAVAELQKLLGSGGTKSAGKDSAGIVIARGAERSETVCCRNVASQTCEDHAFVGGARAALALQGRAEQEPLRMALLAWRCARAEARYARLGDVAAAESLEADLSLVGGHCPMGQPQCCCGKGTDQDSCCRAAWFKVGQLEEEKACAERARVSAATASRRVAFYGIFAAFAFLAVLGLLQEPQLTGGW